MVPCIEKHTCKERSFDYENVKGAIQKYHGVKDLIPVLHEVHRIVGYLTPDVMELIAEELGIPASKVYGVATFYSLFSVRPKGKNIIRICESAPCHVMGADEIIDVVEKELGIKVGDTTRDGKFTLELTSCLGVCGVTPAIMINNEVYSNLTSERVKSVLRELAS